MPGPYAHLTLVHVLQSRVASGGIPGLDPRVKPAVALSPSYCYLGAFAPDCSYFAFAAPGHAEWGDRIHKGGAMAVVRAAAKRVHREPDALRRRQGLAWVLGFASHVVADSVVHPIVNAIAGDYYACAENARRHKECELHQDTYIYQALGLDVIGRAAMMKEIAAGCSEAGRGLNPWIVALWRGSLTEVYGEGEPREPADPARWFEAFHKLIDVADEGHHFGFRERLAKQGLMYVVPSSVAREFVHDLWTPAGKQDYRDVFARAVDATAAMWVDVARAVEGDEAALAARPDLNINDGTANVGPVYWSGR